MNNLVRSVDETKGTESLSNEIRKLYAEIVLQAVVDRISKGVDLAERTDVTARQVRDALRLLQDARSWADWPIEFSRFEIAVISRGIRQSMLDEPMSPACVRPGGLATMTFGGILGNGCG
jgi:hypothetical protein